MLALLKRWSVLTGALLGLIQGIPQGLSLPAEPIFPTYRFETLVTVSVFGLLAPPIFLYLNRVFGRSANSSFMFKLNEYVDILMMMIVGGLSLGGTAYVVYFLEGGEKASLESASFFFFAGLGFMLAYLIDPGMKATLKPTSGNEISLPRKKFSEREPWE